jgi:putative membrane protein insertion efficiency factor
MNERLDQKSMGECESEQPDPDSGRKELSSCFLNGIRKVIRVPGLLAILLVRIYQILVSPLFGKTCRFYPSCSQYFILAVRKYGLIRGSWKGGTRICRCHPWNPGGYDPP